MPTRRTSGTARSPAPEPVPPPPALPPEPPPDPPIASVPGQVQAAAVLLLIFGALSGIGTAFVLVMTLTFAAMPMDPMLWDPSLEGGSTGPCYGVGLPDGSNSCDALSFGFGWFGWVALAATVVMGAIGVAVTAGHLASGVAILRRRAWGRILGLVVSGAALVLLVLAIGTMLIGLAVPMPPFEPMPGVDDPFFDPAMEDYFVRITAVSSAFAVVVMSLVGAAYGYILWVLARRGKTFE